MSKTTEAERAEAITLLREIVQPGDTLITVQRHRSTSGMSRSIDVYRMRQVAPDGALSRDWLSLKVARALALPYDERREAVRVAGTGMNMGFHLVYELGSLLFRDGWDCLGETCRDSSHTNGAARITGERHGGGGYALRQEWL